MLAYIGTYIHRYMYAQVHAHTHRERGSQSEGAGGGGRHAKYPAHPNTRTHLRGVSINETHGMVA